ncbi:cystathionine gamma-synthase [Asticcacaulis excentricus]|uniref:L-methionine gamma-lyase n=1 Tax=Asticcacaulis excentricus (strain ATCC 15261 / DSM 4724 / KCTC 12464 / NCIMB 9791 / VKM B-1370 / CB 48) TaxID=573065 RepID=E8RN10_ASTEC|nr:cystathionine gamma-synthase [Asticcacaulis excentricus]ADU12843.1 O-succinylhomoserine (thiol)-lyase [Asticcacaulis excentricus CB 48]
MSKDYLKDAKLGTKVINIGIDSDRAHGAVMPPIYLSSNYSFAGFGQKRGYDYARSGNPTRDIIADVIAELEGGAGAVMTASGLAALDLLWQDLPNKRVIVPHDCYGGTQRLLNARHRQGLIEVVYVNQGDDAAVESALSQPAGMLLLETPSNPLMRLIDLEKLIALGHAAGAKVAVDNTFLSPALQNPIAFGADFVIHSTTKYINGHSDVIGGALVCTTAEDVTTCRWWANCLGSTPGAFDSYMTLRGVRTLFVRVKQQQESAQAIAEFLDAHPAVSRVFYPGLPSHPQHALAMRQQKGFGAMMSFELAGGLEAVKRVFDVIELFSLAESLGGVESLIVHPGSMTHAAMSPEAQAMAGITEGLLRLSIGLEDPTDLIAALDRALRLA